jgi:tyrosyl-tRNA synthetase
LDKGEPIYLHETFYALMQGYDAVAMETDVQVGGSDQLFNIIVAGRKLQESQGQRPLVGIVTGILPGTDGNQRMSKSTGNIVPINTGANDMFGKLMSVPDSAMGTYMRLVTRWSPHEIEKIEKDVASGAFHPRDAKMKMASEIVSIFYSDAEAVAAQENFIKTFQQKEIPDEMPEFDLQDGQTVVDVILAAKLAESKSKARALIDQKGVRLMGKCWSAAMLFFRTRVFCRLASAGFCG